MTDRDVKVWHTRATYHYDHDGQRWYDAFDTEKHLRMCYPFADLAAVTLIEDPAGPYWAWLAKGASMPTMIRTGEYRFKVQFYSDPAEAEKDGRGRVIRLRIEETNGGVA